MNHVSWTSILIGLALFLFGIDYLSLSLQELSPTRLKNLLAKCTSSTFKAILIGCFITCIIQSSSATTALTVSLINANLMTFSQSIGIIMGANIGTTITAFIVGFDLFQYASFFLIIGAFCLLFSNHPKIKGLAQILFGLGCLFYGLELMSMHLEAITKLPEFSNTFYKSSYFSHAWWSHHHCSYSIIKCDNCYCPTNVSFKSHFPLCFYSLYLRL